MDHGLALMHLLRPLLVVLGGPVGDFCQGLSTQGLLNCLTKVDRFGSWLKQNLWMESIQFHTNRIDPFNKKTIKIMKISKTGCKDYSRKYSRSCKEIQVSRLQTNRSTNQVLTKPINSTLVCSRSLYQKESKETNQRSQSSVMLSH